MTIYKTKYWTVELAENQYYLGRSFVIFTGTKTHLSELNTEEFLDLKGVIDHLENSMKKAFGAVNFNWTCLMNDYYKPKNAGLKKELHLHVWPRYDRSVVIAGESFVDEDFGHHYDKKREKVVSAEMLAKIAEYIK